MSFVQLICGSICVVVVGDFWTWCEHLPLSLHLVFPSSLFLLLLLPSPFTSLTQLMHSESDAVEQKAEEDRLIDEVVCTSAPSPTNTQSYTSKPTHTQHKTYTLACFNVPFPTALCLCMPVLVSRVGLIRVCCLLFVFVFAHVIFSGFDALCPLAGSTLCAGVQTIHELAADASLPRPVQLVRQSVCLSMFLRRAVVRLVVRSASTPHKRVEKTLWVESLSMDLFPLDSTLSL